MVLYQSASISLEEMPQFKSFIHLVLRFRDLVFLGFWRGEGPILLCMRDPIPLCLSLWKQFRHPHPSFSLLRPGSKWLITGARPTKRGKKGKEWLKFGCIITKKLPTIPMGKSQPCLSF